MRRIYFIILILILFFVAVFGSDFVYYERKIREQIKVFHEKPSPNSFDIQSIDTMKYSRDLSREKMNDPSFDKTINEQMKLISDVGANYVAIATPYDEEFLPMLRKWIVSARNNNLHVWLRGNWSGWEGWFGYPKINRQEHLAKTIQFISENPDLFEDGDIFSACPECENGGDGDPRNTNDVAGYRKFLTDECKWTRIAFEKINKKVETNYFSMNADVARLIMNGETTNLLGGQVTIDHYVKTPQDMLVDVKSLSKESGGKIVLGEFGAPISDINGSMTENQQANWIDGTLNVLSESALVRGVNYWVNVGGETQIWDERGMPKKAVSVIGRHFKPKTIFGVVTNELDMPIANAKIQYGEKTVLTDEYGYYLLRYTGDSLNDLLRIDALGYENRELVVPVNFYEKNLVLNKKEKDWKFKLALWIRK